MPKRPAVCKMILMLWCCCVLTACQQPPYNDFKPDYGSAVDVYKISKRAVLNNLLKEDIQFIAYGDTYTLVVPTDHYYLFESAKFDERCYLGLNDIARLLSYYPKCRVTVAAFTDDVGTNLRKLKLSQARAETMLGFLWAHGIPAEKLTAQGYGDRFSIGDNQWIRGSAYNRRIEIQWSLLPNQPDDLAGMYGVMK